MSSSFEIISKNLAGIRDRMADAARRAGRLPESVRLVAITKYVDAATVRELVAAGLTEFGESRPQQLWSKSKSLADLQQIRWHLVGHLQTNKVRRTLPLVEMIQSADSLRIVESIDVEAARISRKVPILLEVNISGEAAKHGFLPHELAPALPALAQFRHVEVRGMMAMAHRLGGPSVAQADFAAMRSLRDELSSDLPPGLSLDELSLGMSGDFEQAILEGATMVRVGSALFEGLDLSSG